MYTPRWLNCGLGVGGALQRDAKKKQGVVVALAMEDSQSFSEHHVSLVSTSLYRCVVILVDYCGILESCTSPPPRVLNLVRPVASKEDICVCLCVTLCVAALPFFNLFECMSMSIEIPSPFFVFFSFPVVVVCAHVSVSICASLIFCSLA